MTTDARPADPTLHARLMEILDRVLAEPLPRPWPADRPLTDAGLDSVGVLSLVAEIEAEFGLQLGEAELTEESLGSVAGLEAMLAGRIAP
ncbi:MAG: acyl carrier protein [Acidobacteriota bacterium]|nr:acyl carrier protein [Acidobacteriota bacterium]MDQ7087030.1 acyl carrier protein [Acidobacteriota bacterium]